MARYYRYDGLAPENLNDIACPVCDGSRSRFLAKDNGYSIVKCETSGCGFVYVNPRPSSEQLTEFYARFYDGDAVVPERWEAEMGDIFRECCDAIAARFGGGDVLDVGCSFGHLLMELERRGFRTTGIEPSPVAAAYAREKLRGAVHTAAFEGVDLAERSFDAVVSLYVLEHVADPRGFLEKVYAVLKPGGLAIIRIPHTEPLFPLQRLLGRSLMYAPMHLNDFSPEALTQLARRVGFTRVTARVGARRKASDLVENAGARVLGGLGRCAEIATSGRWLFPWVGALSYYLSR